MEIFTQKEIKLIKMVVEGYNNQTIAMQNKCSKNTINSFLKNIYKKLGIKNRIQLIAWAVKNIL